MSSYWEVNYPFFTLGRKIGHYKKIIALEINRKWLLLQGVKKKIGQHPAHLKKKLKAAVEKLMQHFQISFKSLFHNADSKLYFPLSKKLLQLFEKKISF